MRHGEAVQRHSAPGCTILLNVQPLGETRWEQTALTCASHLQKSHPTTLQALGFFCSTNYRDSEEDSRKRPGLLLCLSCRKSSNPHCFATRDKLLIGYQHGFHLSLPCASLFTRHRACAWPDKKSWPGVCVWAVRGSADPQGCSSVEGHLPKSEQLGLQHERQR